jgi:hypothetical protein
MPPVERENTLMEGVRAMKAVCTIFSFIPTLMRKFFETCVYIFTNFKAAAIFMCCVLVFLVGITFVIFYTESRYDIKARLADFFVPYQRSNSVGEF